MPTTQLSPHSGENESLSAEVASPEPGPVGNGETDGLATPASVVDPIPAGEIAAAPLNGLGLEESAPSPGVETALDSELPAKIRLGDAEQIAQVRLDGAAEGSLKEALAIAPIEAGARDAPAFDAAAREPAADVAAATLPVAEHVVPEPIAPPPHLRMEAAEASGPAIAEPHLDHPDLRGPGIDPQSPIEAATHPGAVVQPFDGVPDHPAQPLSSALDAATKLAADANAAAQALESLQRLLERQLPTIAPGVAAALPGAADAGQGAIALPSQPPPLPAAPPQARDGEPELQEVAALQPQPRMLVPRPNRMPAERVRLDVRGFLAGFALSWAFGIVLYLFMTAG